MVLNITLGLLADAFHNPQDNSAESFLQTTFVTGALTAIAMDGSSSSGVKCLGAIGTGLTLTAAGPGAALAGAGLEIAKDALDDLEIPESIDDMIEDARDNPIFGGDGRNDTGRYGLPYP
jgi:hypothetical protein